MVKQILGSLDSEFFKSLLLESVQAEQFGNVVACGHPVIVSLSSAGSIIDNIIILFILFGHLIEVPCGGLGRR
jgi:hypothetical protein